ncbi:MAG: 50S ribosomal protein L4 [Opitutales bacterium]|nr:50S ribosomal protein L4 [Opitutales bacterium]NRA26177.1 50S ribosomal protein L4 [Opitutales bacterium]
MKFKLYSADGSSASEKEINEFPEFEGNKGLAALRQVVIAHQANKRQGNASTKTRAEVAGTGKKPFRQKGTGGARQGTRRAPQHYKGGVAFGPKPRDYSQKINRKLKTLAFGRALFDRASAGELDLIEKWEVTEAKTKLFKGILSNIGAEGKTLVVDDAFGDKEVLAARNLEKVAITNASQVNALDLVRYDQIIISEQGMATLLSRVAGGES